MWVRRPPHNNAEIEEGENPFLPSTLLLFDPHFDTHTHRSEEGKKKSLVRHRALHQSQSSTPTYRVGVLARYPQPI